MIISQGPSISLRQRVKDGLFFWFKKKDSHFDEPPAQASIDLIETQ